MLSSGELMDLIINSLDNKIPFSVASVGATESFVLAQYNILNEKEFMSHPEADVAAWGLKRGFNHRGIRFPNIEARDMSVEALKKVDVIGYNMILNDWNAGKLTEKALEYYNIWPKYVFEAYLRHVIMFSQQEKFEKMLAGRKILLICGYADEVKTAMEIGFQKKLGLEVVGTVKIVEYEDIPRVKEELARFDFDLCLLAAGINAVILGSYIASAYGKVAFDIGQAMENFITGGIHTSKYLERFIGMDKLMNM